MEIKGFVEGMICGADCYNYIYFCSKHLKRFDMTVKVLVHETTELIVSDILEGELGSSGQLMRVKNGRGFCLYPISHLVAPFGVGSLLNPSRSICGGLLSKSYQAIYRGT